MASTQVAAHQRRRAQQRRAAGLPEDPEQLEYDPYVPTGPRAPKSPEHRASMSAAHRRRSADKYLGRMSQIREEMESGELAAALDRVLAAIAEQLVDGEMLAKFPRMLINALHSLSEGELREMIGDGMQPPYVGPDTPMHRPMTGTHSHGHAAFGSQDHDDGMHHHAHTHNNDASHDHGHGGLDMRADAAPGEISGSGASGVYGAINNSVSPAERAALRRQQIAAHEARR